VNKAELIKPFAGVAARTNMLKLIDSPEQLLIKLMKGNSQIGAVTYLCREIPIKNKEENEVYYRRVDAAIKSAIRQELGLKNTDTVNYDRLNNKELFMFFFISNKTTGSEKKLLEDIKKYDIELEKAVQTLLSLQLKLSYIRDASTFYDIKPVLYNSKLYIGVIKNTQPKGFAETESLIEVLRLDLFFSKQNEIALSLHKKAFKCVYEENFIPQTDDSCLLFQYKDKTLRKLDELDAIAWAKRPYMAYSQKESVKEFDKYENCINYHLTVALNKLITELSNSSIIFEPIIFKANYIISEFIESNKQYCNPLIIIDTFSSYKTDEERIEFRKYLKQTFNAQDVLGVENAPKPEQLEEKNISYLVINEEQKKNGSSIIRKDTGEFFNSFFQALALYLKNENIPFDYYTLVKLHRFFKKSPIVTQGADIGSITKQQLQKDDNGNKLPSKTVLNELDKNKIQKIKTEIWLKEQIFHYGLIEGLNLPNAELTLFFVRKLENKQTYVSVVDISTGFQGIKINNWERYQTQDKSRFKFKYKYFEKAFPLKDFSFKAIYNEGFYLYDKTNQKLLVSYNSSAIPRIIGNATFDNIEKSKVSNGINRKNSPEICVLPYYLTPTKNKQNYYIFLEDCGQNEVRYFVSKKGDTNATIAKQNKVQNIFVFNHDGSKSLPLEEEITMLFLQSFTFNFLNNNEVSKKSLFQKIAELYIEN